MSLYSNEGASIRAILEAKIDNVLESDVDEDMIRRFVSFVRLLKEISSTRTGEERKDLNVLYMISSSIYSVYFTALISLDSAMEKEKDSPEDLESIDEYSEKLINAFNLLSDTFLTNLKEVISESGSKDRATELFENTYNSLVENVLHKFTM